MFGRVNTLLTWVKTICSFALINTVQKSQQYLSYFVCLSRPGMLRHFSTSPNTFCWPLLYFAISCVKTFCPTLNSTSDTTQFPTASTLCCWRVFLSDPLFPPNQYCTSIAATTVSSRRASTQQRWFSGVRGGIAVRMEVEVPLIPAPSRGLLH